ncbi:hypothetical protein [Aureibacter tunicatorum]|uniref:Uncharacterized protein n=1 Tax=Aureibacter tunicatorum TaxID=866807 RepID=A0AAE4BTM3_9BACT|nr:hypothetical protein [Aureibacter tunicatorum]MDR6240836.1 hypothetical protein [Aureibacter tunicatorum]BDD06831.1 hypothetical protein AUTU_43140 [Aureibacter tunicatorum]
MFDRLGKSNNSISLHSSARNNSVSKNPPNCQFSAPIQCMFKSAKNFSAWKKEARPSEDIDLIDQATELIQTYLHLTSQRADVVSISNYGMSRMIHEILREQMICLHRLENIVVQWNSRHIIWQKDLQESEEVRIYAELIDDIYSQQKEIIRLMKTHKLALPMPSELGIRLNIGNGPYSESDQKLYENRSLSKYLGQLTEGFRTHCRLFYQGNPKEMKQAENDFSALCYLLSHTRTGCALLREMYHLLADQFHADLTVCGYPKSKSRPAIEIVADLSQGELMIYLPKVQASAQWTPIGSKREGLFSQQYGLGISPPQIAFGKTMAGIKILNNGKSENSTSLKKRIEEGMRQEMGLPPAVNSNRFKYEASAGLMPCSSKMEEAEDSRAPSKSLAPRGIHEGHALQFPLEVLELPKFRGFWNMVFDHPKIDFSTVSGIDPVGSGNNSQTFFLQSLDLAGAPVEHVFKFYSDKGNRGDNIEKEAIANNVVRLLGRRVTAPECRVINTDDNSFLEFVKGLETCKHPKESEEEFLDAFEVNKEDDAMVLGLLMSKMEGQALHHKSTPPNLSNRKMKRPLDPLDLKVFEENPALHLALGELAAYNLVLGNGDSMLTVLNSNNMLFDVQQQRLNVFDQSLSLYDMAYIGQIFTSGYNWLGSKDLNKMIENPESHWTNFDRIKFNLSKAVPQAVKTELTCFMEGRYVDSPFIARTIGRTQKYFVNVAFNPMLLSTGFAEGCLRLFEQSNLLELFERIRCLTFPHEYEVFLQNWHAVECVVDKMGYDKIRKKVSKNEARMSSPDYSSWQHKSAIKQVGDKSMKRAESL